MNTAALLLAGLLYSAGPAPGLERLDSLAEDLFDQARAGDWNRATRTLARLHEACAKTTDATCTSVEAAKALALVDSGVQARAAADAMQGANRFTVLLAPSLDASSGGHGVAPLDPAVRRLILDAGKPANLRQDLAALDALTDRLRCDAKPVARFRKRLSAVQAAAATGTIAPALLRALDEGVDQLEEACLPRASAR